MNEVKLGKWTLNNFKSHEYLEFDYSENRLTTITGPNGVGKTSIFDAINWAFYGEDLKGRSGDSIVRIRAGKDTLVEGEWYRNDDHYTIKSYRKHSQHKNNRFIFKNGKEITCTTLKENVKLIENIFMPKQVFKNCLMFYNFAKGNFTDLGHSDQKEILDTMLMLDRYDEYQKSVAEKISEYKDARLDIEKKLPVSKKVIEMYLHQINDINASLVIQEKEFNEKSSNISETIDALTKYNSSKESMISGYDELDSKRNDMIKKISEINASLLKQREICNSEISSCSSKIEAEKAKELDKIKQECYNKVNSTRNELDLANKNKSDINDSKNKTLLQLEKQASSAKNKLDLEYNQSIKPVKEQFDQLKIQENNMTTNMSYLTSEKNKIEKSISSHENKIYRENPICPTCNQEIRDSSIDYIKNEIDKQKNDLKNIVIDLKNISDDKIKIGDELQRLVYLENDIDAKYATDKLNLESKIRDARNKVEKDFSDKLIDIEKECGRLQNIVDELNGIMKERIDKLENNYAVKLESKRASIIEHHKEIAETYAVDKTKYTDELKNIELRLNIIKEFKEESIRNTSKINSLKLELCSLSNMNDNFINNKKKDIVGIEAKIKESEEFVKEFDNSISEIDDNIEILEFWKKAFSDTGIKAILLDEAIPILNEKAIELSQLTSCLRVNFDSQKKLSSGDLRNKFSISALQTTNLSELSNFSAGEERMVNIIVFLCLRHLLEYMQNVRFNILLLDEALDSLDQENASAVIHMLRKLSNDYCIVLISHTFRDYIDSDENIAL